MIRKFKRIMSLMLSCAMVFTTGNVVLANEVSTREYTASYAVGEEMQVEVVNGISTVITENMTVIYNSHTGELRIINAGETEAQVYDLSKALISPAASNSYKAYSYDYYTKRYNNIAYKFWEITIPNKTKLTYQTNLNSTDLQGFKDAVDDSSDAYDDLVKAGYGSVITAVLTGIAFIATGGWGAVIVAILSSLGFDSPLDVVNSFKDLKEATDSAESYFKDVISVSIPK